MRISEPIEFGLDLILKIPFDENVRRLEHGYRPPLSGFVRYYCSSSPKKILVSSKMKEVEKKVFLEFFEENTFVLLPIRVRNWFRTIAEKEIRFYAESPFYFREKRLSVRKCKWDLCSPATTLKIKIENDYEVQVDVVPVFEKGEEMLVAETYPGQQFQKVLRLSYPPVEQ